jgi:hypothetical protein
LKKKKTGKFKKIQEQKQERRSVTGNRDACISKTHGRYPGFRDGRSIPTHQQANRAGKEAAERCLQDEQTLGVKAEQDLPKSS